MDGRILRQTYSIDILKIFGIIKVKKERKEMITEVFKNGRTIGFVVGKDRLSSASMVVKAFPQVDKVKTTYSLPKHDPRCKKIADNVYAWVN